MKKFFLAIALLNLALSATAFAGIPGSPINEPIEEVLAYDLTLAVEGEKVVLTFSQLVTTRCGSLFAKNLEKNATSITFNIERSTPRICPAVTGVISGKVSLRLKDGSYDLTIAGQNYGKLVVAADKAELLK